LSYTPTLSRSPTPPPSATSPPSSRRPREAGAAATRLLKALLLVRGDAATAIAVAVPASLATTAVEGLFQLRVMKLYIVDSKISSAIVRTPTLHDVPHAVITVMPTPW
jgi:hypothetical protein